MLIKVEESGGKYNAIFTEPELKAKNNGQTFKLQIDKMYDYFKGINDMTLYNYFESMITLVSLMCLERNYNGINILVNIFPI